MSNSDMLKDQVVHNPHPPLTEYYRREDDKPDWLQRMFDQSAPNYEYMEAILGLGSGSWYRRQALLRAGLGPGMRVLDVGMGTGLVARQAVLIVGDPTKVMGMDPSTGMRQNAKVPPGVAVVEGRAERIPFSDHSFDFLSMGYALRHVSDLSVTFSEFFRVLKPGGRLCVLEITPPRGRIGKAILKTYLRGVVPALAKLTTWNAATPQLWRYHWDTIEACAPPPKVLFTLESLGFVQVDPHVELGIFSEYRARKPTA